MNDKKELETLASRTFSIIELIEISGVDDKTFKIIRKKLLDLGNDIKRLSEKGGE